MPQDLTVIVTIISGLTISIVSGMIIAIVKRGWTKKDIDEKKMKEIEEKINQTQRSIWRLNKTILIMAKILDEQTEKGHPELMSNLENIATELLGESNKS